MSTPWLQGDYIQKGSDKRKILGVCGEVLFLSLNYDYESLGECSFHNTQVHLEVNGWSLVPKEESWPKMGDVYWRVRDDGRVVTAQWDEHAEDRDLKYFGNVHRTLDAALAWREKVKAIKNPKT